MTWNDIVRKLTSRKFWMAVAGFVSGLIVALGESETTAETVSGLIMSGASVLGYLLAEGLADSSSVNITYEPEDDKETSAIGFDTNDNE